jgi:hypothetical protein
MTEEKFVPGTQIVYIPLHAKGDIDHKDSLRGFVTSKNNTFVFCRFWKKDSHGFPIMELRNKLNSEACNKEDLVEYISVPKLWVNQALDQIANQ